MQIITIAKKLANSSGVKSLIKKINLNEICTKANYITSTSTIRWQGNTDVPNIFAGNIRMQKLKYVLKNGFSLSLPIQL